MSFKNEFKRELFSSFDEILKVFLECIGCSFNSHLAEQFMIHFIKAIVLCHFSL